jgi:hypothetical protein
MSEAPYTPPIAREVGRDIPYKRRREYTPSWSFPFPDERLDENILDHDGNPFIIKGIEVKIGHIPESRRWAIREDGQMMDQREFKEALQNYILGHYRLAGAEAESIHHYPIPKVEKFLSLVENPTNPEELIPIQFNPNAKAPIVPKRKFNPEDSVVDVQHGSEGWSLSRGSEETTDEYAERIAQATGAEPMPAGPNARLGAKLDLLDEMLAEGTVTQEMWQAQKMKLMGEILGVDLEELQEEAQASQAEEAQEETQDAPEEEETEFFALCRKSFNNERSVRLHQQRCKKCKEIDQALLEGVLSSD